MHARAPRATTHQSRGAPPTRAPTGRSRVRRLVARASPPRGPHAPDRPITTQHAPLPSPDDVSRATTPRAIDRRRAPRWVVRRRRCTGHDPSWTPHPHRWMPHVSERRAAPRRAASGGRSVTRRVTRRGGTADARGATRRARSTRARASSGASPRRWCVRARAATTCAWRCARDRSIVDVARARGDGPVVRAPRGFDSFTRARGT